MPATVTNAQAGDKQLNSEEAATIKPKDTPRDAEKKKESTGWEKPKS